MLKHTNVRGAMNCATTNAANQKEMYRYLELYSFQSLKTTPHLGHCVDHPVCLCAQFGQDHLTPLR